MYYIEQLRELLVMSAMLDIEVALSRQKHKLRSGLFGYPTGIGLRDIGVIVTMDNHDIRRAFHSRRICRYTAAYL